MRRLVVFVFLVTLGASAQGRPLKPYLRIETGKHTAKVSRIDADAAERFLVSASDDKTARVWDLSSGKLLKILRPPIGDGNEGKLFSVAMSPDGKTVAVGGFTGADGSGNYPIYIFDREGGTIRKTIIGLPSTALHLAYSKDGRYLAAALSGKSGIRIYQTGSYSEVARDSDYDADSYWIEFDKSGKLVTTTLGGVARLYSADFHLLRQKKPPGGKKPFAARFSPDGSLIAVGFDDTIAVDVLSANDLSFLYTLQLPAHGGNLSGTLWSADGRTVCAAGSYPLPGVTEVICASDAGSGKLSTFPVSSETVMDIRALRDGGIAFVTFDGEVGVLDRKGVVQWRDAPDLLDYRRPVMLRVSSDGNNVAADPFLNDGATSTRRTIDFSIADERLEVETQSRGALQGPVTEGLAIANWKDDEHPTLDGHALHLDLYEMSRSLAIAPNQDSFVLGSEWNIYRFDRQSKQIWKTSVPGAAWGVNVTSDRRFVVAALGDGTVRWYTFDTGDEVLALFVDHDLKRWVAWTPDGFFDFASGGDALIGYQINRGPDQAGDFVKVDQLREVFYRPDLIAQVLKPGGVESVLLARRQVGDISQILSGGLPPEIESIAVTPTDEPNKYLVQFRVKDTGGGRGRIVYRIDGVEIEARDAVDIKGVGSDTFSRYITVGSGQHTFAVAAYSANGKVEGAAKTVPLTGRQPLPGTRTSLYVIAAGISHYSDHSLDQGVKFASQDADLVAARFQEQQGKGLYQRVKTVALPDSKATAKNIRDAVAQAATAIQPGDTFILYLAGHGIAVDGEYYFIPWDAEYTNQEDLLAKSLNREAIQTLLKEIHTNKSVLMLDTCGSGAYLDARATNVSEKAAIEKVATMSGRAVIAASNSDEMAMDGYQNHGVFTYALLQGLQAADSDAQGEILITRLAEYIQSRVPSITLEVWHYKQTPLSRIEGEPFPIAHKTPN